MCEEKSGYGNFFCSIFLGHTVSAANKKRRKEMLVVCDIAFVVGQRGLRAGPRTSASGSAVPGAARTRRFASVADFSARGSGAPRFACSQDTRALVFNAAAVARRTGSCDRDASRVFEPLASFFA